MSFGPAKTTRDAEGIRIGWHEGEDFRAAEALLDGQAVAGKRLRGDEERKIKPLKPTTFVGHLRRALALATLRHQPPDLVVLDEFQRYRQLLDEKDADPLLKALLEPHGSVARPAILLLSATPYRLLSTRWEEAQGALAHAELLELIEFLAGRDVRDRAKALFSDFGDKLRDIAVHAEATDPSLEIEINEAAGLRDALRALLTPVMSRTERDSVASGDPLAGTQFFSAEPIAEDFQIYRHLADSFPEDVRYEALPYWSSVPLMTLKLRGQERQRLSYRTLDVEQIGSVYETVMGFTVEVAESRVLAIKAGKNNRTPVFVALDELLKRKGKDRIKDLKENVGRSLTAAQAKPVEAAATVEDLAAALDGIVDERGSPRHVVASPGTPILQPTDERRRTGSHYTPRSLTQRS